MAGGRRRIAGGMAAGFAWAAGLLTLGVMALPGSEDALAQVAVWLLLPALTLIAVIGWIARARFFDPAMMMGDAPAPGGAAEIDQRVLRNTVEQLVLAIPVWAALAVQLPIERRGVIPALAIGFVIARLAFWIGYHRAPAARAFGFAATFYPTVLAAGWAMALLVTRGAA